jgi:hypothetical protein
LIDFNFNFGEFEIFAKPCPSTKEMALFPPTRKGDNVIINSLKRLFLINSQFTVPPPSTKIVLIFLLESFFNNNFRFIEFFPATIISIGNFCNFNKFILLIFFETTIIVGISLLVLMILELIGIVPLESKIILMGFFL